MAVFVCCSLLGIAIAAAGAARWGSPRLSRFTAITLLVHLLVAAGVQPHVGGLWPAFYALQALATAYVAAVTWPGVSPGWWHALSYPAAWFVAGTSLAWPWALGTALGLSLPGLWLPYVVAGTGIWLTLGARRELVVLDLSSAAPPSRRLRRAPHLLSRARRPRGAGLAPPELPGDALRLVQLTDPHLGPFMSEARLARFCQRAVDARPDLILLTGDYLTLATQHEAGPLSRALAPLRAHPQVYACLGNHDHEALPHVVAALGSAGVRLLVDQSAIAETRLGPVEVVGLDFHFRGPARRIPEVLSRLPRRPGPTGAPLPRLLLLHHPGHFPHVPEGAADLVLSGHTHGGQVGLLSLGLPWTALSLFARFPDHGAWVQGGRRLYVHRGTGHYGFPLRIGVPAEESLLVLKGLATAPPP